MTHLSTCFVLAWIALGLNSAELAGQSQAREPIGMAMLPSGDLIILDAGGLLYRLGTDEPSPGLKLMLKLPGRSVATSIAAAELLQGGTSKPAIFATLYYSGQTTYMGLLVQYRIDGAHARQWELPWQGLSQGIAIDQKRNRVYVTHSDQSQVYRLDLQTGKFDALPSLARNKPGRVGPLAIDVSGNRLFAADTQKGRFFEIHPDQPKPVWIEGTDTAPIIKASALAYHDANGSVYLTDESKGCVWELKKNSKTWNSLVPRKVFKDFTKKLPDPISIAVGRSALWVGDTRSKSILEIALSGESIVNRY